MPIPGSPADQDQGARHDAAAEDPVELGDARVDAGGPLGRHGGQGDRGRRGRGAPGRGRAPAAGRAAGDARPLLDDRVELAAVGAAAVPLARLEAAGLAPVDGHGPHGVALRRRPAARRPGGRPPADRGADERAQEQAPLGPLQEGGEVLVDRRVLDQAAERPLAALDPSRDGAEVGHRLAQVGQRLAELRVPAESLGELPEARQRLRHLLDALLAAGLRERPEHALAPGDPPGDLTETPRRLPEVPRQGRIHEQGAEDAVLGARAIDRLREPVGGRHHAADRASRVRIAEQHAERALAPLDPGEERAGPRERGLEILQDPPLVVDERVEGPRPSSTSRRIRLTRSAAPRASARVRSASPASPAVRGSASTRSIRRTVSPTCRSVSPASASAVPSFRS